MVSQDDNGQQALVLALVFGLVALVIALVTGVAVTRAVNTSNSAGTGQAGISRPNPIATMLTASAVAFSASAAAGPQSADSKSTEAAQIASDAASIRVESGVVKFYFASAKAELAPGSVAVLADLIASAKAGRKLVISGFHDATGDPVRNAELARQRALAVITLLKASGVSVQQIELGKPQQVQLRDSDAEARRVEVKLQ
jgi:K(+)-stimulated pyrophosphate-energized sodium pump